MNLPWPAVGLWPIPLLLAACATSPPDDGPAWTRGRLSVSVEATGERPASRVTADFDLRGDSRRGELRLTSTLGARLAQARWSPAEVVLDLGQGETRFPDLEELSRHSLGEAVPLQAFPDWLAGRPWPGAPNRALPDGFEQLGWTVSFAALGQGRIDAVRDAPPRVSVRVRLDRGDT